MTVCLSPSISVIVPVYNGARTVEASIQSLLDQHDADFEVIVIDDGSTDDSASLIGNFDDPRVRSFRQENRGLAATLNRGIELARGPYLARLDQDDQSHPARLSRQIAFMEKHPEVALLGTWARIYEGEVPSKRSHRHPTSSKALKLELLLDNPFVHSSVMMRADVARQLGGYHVERLSRFPEDYELWSRVAAEHEIANLPEELTIYREVPGSITRTAGEEILANVRDIATHNLSCLLAGIADEVTCRAFTSLYHGLPASARLTRVAVLDIWKEAGAALNGHSSGWSTEFRATHARIQRRLDKQLLKRAFPREALVMLQRARRVSRA